MDDWELWNTFNEYAAAASDCTQVLLYSANWGMRSYKIGSIQRGRLYTIGDSFAFDYVNNPPTHWKRLSPPKLDLTPKENQSLLPWVIVEHAGCDNECVVGEFSDLQAAALRMRTDYRTEEERDEAGADIMKRLPDGSLTTEY